MHRMLQTSGGNIQSANDHQCQFIFFAVAWPGVMGAQDAVRDAVRNAVYDGGICIESPR